VTGVSLGDGVRVDLADGTRVALDGGDDGDVTALSHAHGDHYDDAMADDVVASELTAALARERFEADLQSAEHPAVERFPAGHVAGSRALRVTDPDTGRRYLYTGDFCPRDRLYLDGFDPVDADVLVVEATYGEPGYDLPPTDEVLADAVDWLAALDAPALLFGYALGRAQKLLKMAERAGCDRIFVSDAIARCSAVVERHADVSFRGQPWGDDVDLGPGDALVLPSGTSRMDFVERLAEAGAVRAGFSGWAVDESFRYRGGYDETFPLSDHADFDELLATVDAVDPETVYVQHGFAAELAGELTGRGYDARELKANQSTLADF
jgi:putative mRNA 3-end processing factor